MTSAAERFYWRTFNIGGMTKGQIQRKFAERDALWPVLEKRRTVRAVRAVQKRLGRAEFSNICEKIITDDSFRTEKTRRLIRVGRASLIELGFNPARPPSNHILTFPNWEQIAQRVESMGGYRLPFETGAHVRLQLENQEPGDSFYVLSDPLKIGEYRHVFVVSRDPDDDNYSRSVFRQRIGLDGLEKSSILTPQIKLWLSTRWAIPLPSIGSGEFVSSKVPNFEEVIVFGLP